MKLRDRKSNRIAAFCAVLLAVILLSCAGRILVVDNAQSSDVAIVLDGGSDDVRTIGGLELLRAGYTRELVLDAPARKLYGRLQSDYLHDYVEQLPADIRGHVHVCSFAGNSTKLELLGDWDCLRAAVPGASKMLLITSDYHTRRSLSIARRLFPQVTWTAAAVSDPAFGVEWWRKREWAKTCLMEWQKLIWWQLFERWQK